MASSRIVTGNSDLDAIMAHDSGNHAARSSAASSHSANDMLELLASELAGCPSLDLEFSVKLSRGTIRSNGRFSIWINGSATEDFLPMGRLLQRLEAPDCVAAAQQNGEFVVRQAIGVAMDDSGIEFRLYLHGRDAVTLADRYEAWRWGNGDAARHSTYSFHFMPETASGVRPAGLVNDELHPAVERLLAEPRLLQLSGFWLRRDDAGTMDQVDIALPWHPRAGTLQGLAEVAAVLKVPEEELARWRELPLRHVAFSVGKKSPSVTLYASAALARRFPNTEGELQAQVLENSLSTQKAVEAEVFQTLEVCEAPSHNTELGEFYDGPIETWQAILGPELHYHAGLFQSSGMSPSDEEMTQALRRAVTELYPFLRRGEPVYDLGCGWGGPLEMFIRDLGCPSLGLTVSRRQFQYIASRGLPVRWGDAESTLPPGHFDSIVLLESLSHVRDKERLLKTLRPFTRQLVMRVNCQDSLPPCSTFGGTMHMISSGRLREMLEATGWKITHWRDRRSEAIPSVAVWRRRLQSLPMTGDQHLETFRAWCERVMSCSAEWARHNPLIELVAEHL
jgi:methyltransferase family protein